LKRLKIRVKITRYCSFPVEDESGPKPEALNKKAVAIVNRVRDKLTGILLSHAIATRSKVKLSDGRRFYRLQVTRDKQERG